MKQKPVLLMILDGWGYREPRTPDNAIETGHTPNWHRMYEDNPHCLIETYGLAVGLPEGQMGNSEVGHTNLGAGRVVMQDLPKIDLAIKDRTDFFMTLDTWLTRHITTSDEYRLAKRLYHI